MADTGATKMQDLVDRSEILQCITRCARGMDRHDAEMIASCYHSDATDDHGTFRGSPEEFIAFVNGTPQTMGAHEAMFDDHMHVLANHHAEIDGDTAHAETYYLMVGKYRDHATTGFWAGRYIDRLERRSGRWAIAVRRVVMGPTAEMPGLASAGVEALATFVKGAWDKSDISYERPLRVPKA